MQGPPAFVRLFSLRAVLRDPEGIGRMMLRRFGAIEPMPDNCNTRAPGYTQGGQMPLSGTSWNSVLPGNGNRISITFGRGNIGGTMLVGGPAGTGLVLTLNDAQPTQTVTRDQYGDAVTQPWYVNTNGSTLVVTWSEMLCWPC